MSHKHSFDSEPPLPTGYELERRLGVGSFGSVMAVARQPQHHQRVAVKTIDKRQWRADDECGGLHAIRQEALALRELNGHPNIIGFVDAVETDEHYHLITQHNTGGDLYEHLYETTYTFTEEDLMSEDEWGDDMDQSITPRGSRTLFLNEREAAPTTSPVASTSAQDDVDTTTVVRKRELQGAHATATATSGDSGDSDAASSKTRMAESPRAAPGGGRTPRTRVVEMKEFGGRLSEAEAQPLFRQLVRALRHCHAHRIAHRDLKPENVFLDDDDAQTVLLGDFGLCLRFTPGQPRFVPCCGSLLYLAPEIIKQQPYVGPEIDLWGLDLLLYEMLCGYAPFQGPTDEATRQRILSGAVAFPDHVSTHARSLIAGLLQVDPALRLDLDAVKKHPWNLFASQQLQQQHSLASPRSGLISPRMLLNRNRAGLSGASTTAPTAAKPFSLNLAGGLTAPRTIPSPRYETTSPRRMALPRPLVNPDTPDTAFLAIPGGADDEMPVMTRARASSGSSPRGAASASSSSTSSSSLRAARPALWHSPQLSSPDPSPRGGPGGLRSLVSPRGGASYLSAAAVSPRGLLLSSPRSRLSPGSPRGATTMATMMTASAAPSSTSAAANRIYYSLMTMEEERTLRRRQQQLQQQQQIEGAESRESRPAGEESDTSEGDSDLSESDEDDAVGGEQEDETTRKQLGRSSVLAASEESESEATSSPRESVRERLRIGRIDLSLVKGANPARTVPALAITSEMTADLSKAVAPEPKESAAARRAVSPSKKRPKDQNRGGDRLHDPRAPIYSAQSPLESPRIVEGRSRSSSFGAAHDKVAVVDFVSTMRREPKQGDQG